MTSSRLQKWYEVFYPVPGKHHTLSWQDFECELSGGLTRGCMTLHDTSSSLILLLSNYGSSYHIDFQKYQRLFHNLPVSLMSVAWDGHLESYHTRMDFQQVFQSLEILLLQISQIDFIRHVIIIAKQAACWPAWSLACTQGVPKVAYFFFMNPDFFPAYAKPYIPTINLISPASFSPSKIRWKTRYLSSSQQYSLFRHRMTQLDMKRRQIPIYWFFKSSKNLNLNTMMLNYSKDVFFYEFGPDQEKKLLAENLAIILKEQSSII